MHPVIAQLKLLLEEDNYRNGTYPKTVDSNFGPVSIDVPRDRNGTFSPYHGAQRLKTADRC
ncbi:transposase [Corynebacterium macginleyi]|uniref:transposase n=1 Tax=Corynebacterium macginleyi TaxID=38290 RepID=UPI00398BB048